MNASVVPRAPANPLELPWNALNVNQVSSSQKKAVHHAISVLLGPIRMSLDRRHARVVL